MPDSLCVNTSRKYIVLAQLTTLALDMLFSLIVTLSGGNIGPYNGHYDYHLGINPDIDVQHQFKQFYNVPLPYELSHLVKM
jgi:hypothetical protein